MPPAGDAPNGAAAAPPAAPEGKPAAVTAEAKPAGAAGPREPPPWRRRFADQLAALAYKQALVYGRNSRATLLRLAAPLFFMALLWLLDLAVRATAPGLSTFENLPTPAVDAIGPIPPCADDFFARDPCYDFFFTPSGSARAAALADAVRARNPGRPIPPEAVLSFATIEDANAWLLANPEAVAAGFHVLESTDAADPGLDFLLQTNSTIKYFKDRYQDPTFFAAAPLQAAVEREAARAQWEAAGKDPAVFQWEASVSQFAHPETGAINIVGQAMGPFVFAASLFNFVVLLSAVAAERETGLRQALTTAGMLDSGYWCSWLAVELTLSVVFALLLAGFGAAFGFGFFLKNSFGLVLALFILFQWAMVGVAFILGAFIARATSAVTAGFVVFLVGWVVQSVVVFGYPFTPADVESTPAAAVIFALMPWALLAKGAVDLGAAGRAPEGETGISWARRSEYCQDLKGQPEAQDALFATAPDAYWKFNCTFSLGSILAILAVEFVAYVLIAVYLDNVIGTDAGVRKRPWYFLTPSYWATGRRRAGTASAVPRIAAPAPAPRGATAERLADASERRAAAPGGADPDVTTLEAEMRALAARRAAGDGAGAHAVEMFGLERSFGASNKFCCCVPRVACCCGRRGAPAGAVFAVRGSWFPFERDRLTALLGPNGAGKTTTINLLTGALPPTGGDALVCGESIRAPGGLDRIRARMGVCPQFDVQWPELTALEHVWIYGRVRGMPRAEVRAEGARLLESVKLSAAARVRSGAFSGGMRRRLSVALAMLGDPEVLYLDEPTTGMDPISRRHVWDAIEAAKPGRAVVLTTHSMEEADVLGDVVAIMARGRLRAHGAPLRLKQRFGSGYQISVSVAGGKKGAGGGANGVHGANGASAADLRALAAGAGAAPASDAPAAGTEAERALAARAAAVAALFEERLGVGAAQGSQGGYLLFHVPRAQEAALPALLRELEARRAELGVADVQASLTSLEEVFLLIARRAEVEAAAAEGRAGVPVELPDGSTLEAPLGAEEATDGKTGVTYALTWTQDERGALTVRSATRSCPVVGGGAPAPAQAEAPVR